MSAGTPGVRLDRGDPTSRTLGVCDGKETHLWRPNGGLRHANHTTERAAAAARAQMDDMGASAMAWAPANRSVRFCWAIGDAPSFPTTGTDLIAFTGWCAVGLCAAAGGITLALRTAPSRWPLLVAAWW